MLMASRLLYGMAQQRVLPRFLGKVHPAARTPWAGILFTTAIAFASSGSRPRGARRHHLAAAAVRVHDRQHRGAGPAQDPVEHDHFHARR
jgi:hypothetical protein